MTETPKVSKIVFSMQKLIYIALLGFFSYTASHAADPYAEAVSKLSNKNATVRRQGVEALGEIRNPAAVPALIKLLSAQNPSPQSAP